MKTFKLRGGWLVVDRWFHVNLICAMCWCVDTHQLLLIFIIYAHLLTLDLREI